MTVIIRFPTKSLTPYVTGLQIILIFCCGGTWRNSYRSKRWYKQFKAHIPDAEAIVTHHKLQNTWTEVKYLLRNLMQWGMPTLQSITLGSREKETSTVILCNGANRVGRDSSVGIATRYGLDGPGIECRWGRDFQRLSRTTLVPTQPPIHWVPALSRG